MSLRIKYILFIILIHLVFTILLLQLFKDQLYFFLLSESLIFISLYISIKLYQALIRPIALMKTGVNAIIDEDFNTKFLKTGSYEMDQLILVFNRMLDRLRQERTRTEEQAYFLENLINASPIGMIILDYDENISSMNAQAMSCLSIKSKEVPKTFSEIDHPFAIFIKNLESGRSEIFTINGILQYKCQIEPIFHRGFYRKFIVIEELSSELIKSEKLAYGKVIRMMAHEVNNSMGAINSILQTVIDFGFKDEENADLKESLMVAMDRNNSLADFVKNFAKVIRLPLPNKTSTNLLVLIERCVGIFSSQFYQRQISVRVNCAEEPPTLMMDPIQIEQVVLNILKNAMESIDYSGHIHITLSTNKPQLVIADDGPGILPKDEEMIFSPFFSTKPNGQGIGLILTREILTNHEAQFSLVTDPLDQWTKFSLSF